MFSSLRSSILGIFGPETKDHVPIWDPVPSPPIEAVNCKLVEVIKQLDNVLSFPAMAMGSPPKLVISTSSKVVHEVASFSIVHLIIVVPMSESESVILDVAEYLSSIITPPWLLLRIVQYPITSGKFGSMFSPLKLYVPGQPWISEPALAVGIEFTVIETDCELAFTVSAQTAVSINV